ncbi:MrcB family domain-containing protein [Methylobacterium nonmethylotrophicum]|uniref:MrcB family domain-containing protein n=1 Tax=Methylobacterium nonmethylotrophicum TaxID=1141884 RepID=UPI00315DCF68
MLGDVIRGAARQEVAGALGSGNSDLLVKGSPGQGIWAEVPWLSVFDPLVTRTATQGYYVVYLFHARERLVHLSLNQGTTEVLREFRGSANQVLTERAVFVRRRLADFAPRLPVHAIDLGSDRPLPSGYAAGHAMGMTYRSGAMPDETTLRHDLQTIVAAYRALTFRGGLTTSTSSSPDEGPTDLLEERRYRMHRRIERNPHAARRAKQHHGIRCQACDLVMAERYGSPGEDFIEVHHLRPLASLREGEPVRYDVATDFAVLCPNCHRMIHRMADPSDLDALREVLHATS